MKGVASSWRRMKHRYNLYSTKCENCSGIFFPPRIICPRCRRAGKMVDLKLCGRGKIVSFTTVHSPPEGYTLQAPYLLAIIRLEEGPMLTAQIVETDESKIRIGTPVEMVFRKLIDHGEENLISYGYKFRVAGKV